jgi:integrase/recombinase XerD
VSGREWRTPATIAGDASDLAGFPRLVGEFCADMAARGYSGRTVGNRRFMLSYLVAWLAERGITRPVEVTRPVLESYQRWLFHYRKANGDPLSFRSQSQRLLAVRAFFKWAARHRHVLHNPASEIELPKAERRLPRPALTAAEAELVLAQPDLDGPTGVRDRAILEVFYSTGIRRFELAALAVTDIDCERATLLVRQGKGRKDRLVPIGQRALAWVGKYLAEVRPRLVTAPDDSTLFLTSEGTGFGLDGLTRLASVYVKASGVPKAGACHLFRHTMATLMLEGGADIRYIQAMLGHAELSTTQIYAQVSVRALQAIHTATHPAASNTPRSGRTGHSHGGHGDDTGHSQGGHGGHGHSDEGGHGHGGGTGHGDDGGHGDGSRHDGGGQRKAAVTELLAALGEEDQDENRAPTGPPGASP